jgi:putative DNA primase/helicase
VSQGGNWPDGSSAGEGKVVIWSGEDGHADTIVPRLAMAGANRSNVELVTDISAEGKRRPFDPAIHTEILAEKLALIGSVRLLILDPVVSAVAGNGNANNDVRRGLQPLVDLANKTGCAVLGITHFSKGTAGSNPLERVTGSLAFGAVARVVLVTGDYKKQEEDQIAKRVLCRAKSNIGPDEGGFLFEITEVERDDSQSISATSIKWSNWVQGKAIQLLRPVDQATNVGSALIEAKDFLEEALSRGPVSRQVIEKEGNDQGIKWITIRRACELLGIQKNKDGMQGGWFWSLPNAEDAQDS